MKFITYLKISQDKTESIIIKIYVFTLHDKRCIIVEKVGLKMV